MVDEINQVFLLPILLDTHHQIGIEAKEIIPLVNKIVP